MESLLNKFIAGLTAAVEDIRAYQQRQQELEIERQRREQERQFEERRRQEALQRRHEEQARTADLGLKVEQWERARRLRSFAAAARAAAQARGESVTADSVLGVWLAWAEARASDLDPLTTGRPEACWPPPPGCAIRIKVKGLEYWSVPRECDVALVPPPPEADSDRGPDETASPSSPIDENL